VKLFQRTLGSFIGVLTLQALLTGAALSSIFGSMQAEDAAREVSTEAANAYESFNAWKLAFWKEINEIAEDSALAEAVSSSRVSPEADIDVVRALSARHPSSAAVAMVLRDEATGACRYLGAYPSALKLPDPSSFRYMKAHPYVEIAEARASLWFVGAVQVAPRAGRSLDLFIVKRIDADLLGHLSYDQMVAIVVLVQGKGPRVAGMYSGAAGGLAALSFVRDSLVSAAGLDEGEAYRYYSRLQGPGGFYSVVVRLTGSVSTPDGERPVLLAAVLSLTEYSSREASLERSVAAVSFAIVALTIVVALVLSRSIVSPIRKLSNAMRRIEGGDYRAEVRGSVSGEIGELLEGFNVMARKISSDKLELEAYIDEIVGLKERGDGIIESIREGLAVIDSEGRIESANFSFRSMFGAEATVPGACIEDIEKGPFDESLIQAAREAMRAGARPGVITRRAPDGRSFEIKLYPLAVAARSAGRPDAARCIVVIEDSSERLAYEERAIQAERLASIGMLSAGIAHEINNPLSSILANVGNAINETDDPEAAASLRVVESETLRIARIVRQLLDFSAPRGPEESRGEGLARCDANAVVRDLVLLVGYPFRGGAVVFSEVLDPDCPEAAISEDELKQILLNLLRNALNAVRGIGRIKIETKAVSGCVEVSVSDTGPGIPQAILGRIFDPFFTTNAGEGGTGLGLSVAYGIVMKRGGSIQAGNGAEGGGIFVLRLPEATAMEAP
jgi:signal transduction histidine kinase/HAMP domain-containing protein